MNDPLLWNLMGSHSAWCYVGTGAPRLRLSLPSSSGALSPVGVWMLRESLTLRGQDNCSLSAPGSLPRPGKASSCLIL